MPQKSVDSNQEPQPSKPLDENSKQPLCDISQVSSNSSLERERKPPSITRDRSVDDSSHDSDHILIKLSRPSTHSLYNFRSATYNRSDTSTDREIPQESDEIDDRTQREQSALNTVVLHAGSIQDSDRENDSSVGAAMRQEELSLPRSTVGQSSNKHLLTVVKNMFELVLKCQLRQWFLTFGPLK